MKRRDFLKFAAGGSAVAAASVVPAFAAVAAAAPGTAGDAWRTFEFTYDIDLTDREGPARLWVPLPLDSLYQRSLLTEWTGNAAKAALHTDPVYGARMLYAEWDHAVAGPRQLRLTSQVQTRDRVGPAPALSLAETEVFLKATEHMPKDGIVLKTAQDIVKQARARTAEQKARAVYDWIVENTFRDPKVKGCGRGDIRFILESGNFGGKCADLNALFVGLVRAVGVPAREVYGIRVADSRHFKSIGKGGDITKAQHCRAEFHQAGKGWVPVDPADVRKIVLEEQLELKDPRVAAIRRQLFGHWEMNWVAFNYARDFQLAPAAQAPVNYLMYPHAETRTGVQDSLEPQIFAYRIESRELKG